LTKFSIKSVYSSNPLHSHNATSGYKLKMLGEKEGKSLTRHI
jgi:hypothetical protein